jgi:hypothetical protein
MTAVRARPTAAALILLSMFLVSRTAFSLELKGVVGASPRWLSGWIDLAAPTDFRVGDRLRLRIGGTAEKIVVRLLPADQFPDSPIGIIAGALRVPPSRIVEIVLTSPQHRVVQISVHGGQNPWGLYPLGDNNGPATVEAAEVVQR